MVGGFFDMGDAGVRRVIGVYVGFSGRGVDFDEAEEGPG